ncbi:nucleophile aminohydrolase [Piptocephalis cylindrospora]|uniref:Nucleophile aminohydrolase n=1 Tax=Piptocephalis cylindrospora TaxID=1907219 RepID=A0A4P9Y2W9_9FUNG|nr:nucleophile aminohydrolase [Piptocephalis cylindrospora]|eukprot:RKP12160.1 nucleophile aminohydrolase [Piptocephalis cylindrospora]
MHAAVASEHKTCSNIGARVLQDGGSSVDAAIASTICVGSINSFSSGIGGGGFMLIRDANGTSQMIDFRETAPGAASEGMFVKDPVSGIFGPLAIAIPGELRGLEEAHRQYGKLPWNRLFEPSIALNRNGFPITAIISKRLRTPILTDVLLRDPGFKEVFAPNGTLLNEGDICYRPRYAETLEMVSRHGADAFYKGKVAEWMVEDIKQLGGIITLKDLSDYKAVLRKTKSTYYHGRRIITGGEILNILERYNFGREDNASRDLEVHRMVEAFKYGFADRGILGDPGYVKGINQVAEELMRKERSDRIRANISDERTFPMEYYHPKFLAPENHGTMHLSVVDGSNQAVSLMSTVNLYFGSGVMSPKTGVIFNNEMADFSSPNQTNVFDLPASPNNYIHPGKRPMSSGTPTIVEKDGKFEMALGASGGTRIITAVIQVLLNTLDYDMGLADSVEVPRVHHQLYPESLSLEDGFPLSTSKFLEAKGHVLEWAPVEKSQSAIQVVRRLASGIVQAVSDGRKHGLASAI